MTYEVEGITPHKCDSHDSPANVMTYEVEGERS